MKLNKEQSEWLKASLTLIFLVGFIAIYSISTFQLSTEKKLFDIQKKYIEKKIIIPKGESFSLIIVGEPKGVLIGRINIKNNGKTVYKAKFNTNSLPKGEFVYKLERYKYNNYELIPIDILTENHTYTIELEFDEKPTGTFSLWLSGLFNYIQI